MGETIVTNHRRVRWHRSVRALTVAALGLVSTVVSLEAQAGLKALYMYRDKGMPVYTDQKPGNVPYKVIMLGRPTAAATSCAGVTEAVMQERASNFQKIVTKHALANGVPAGLVRAVMRVESCFDLRAVSRVGARGLMQLMPATASQLGVHNSFDADQNIGGGVRYLRMMLQRFNNDTRLAVAAYNAGPEAVATHRGVPPFPETRRYVERVLTAYRNSGGMLPKLKAVVEP